MDSGGYTIARTETSHNFNGSFDWWYRNYSFTVTAYYNHIIDRIATGLPYSKVEDPSQLYLKYVNLAPYDIMGGEATVEGRWNNGLSAKLSYALTHEVFAKDKDGNPTNNQYIPPASTRSLPEWTGIRKLPTILILQLESTADICRESQI